jgi:hypothetical protein
MDLQPDKASPRRGALLAAGAAAAAAVLGAAAWWGQQQAAGLVVPAPVVARPAAAGAASGPAQQAAWNPQPTAAAKNPAWPIWEHRLRQPIPPRDPSLTPPPWRLIGATASGGRWQLIIQTQGKPEPQYLKVGDTLPGGSRIVAITEEDVTLMRGRQQIVLSYIGY